MGGPLRIVSLTCSNTEIVAALGCADRLVGIDDHSDFPEEVVSRLPRLGPDLSIDVDRVRALEPDLVLASLTVPGHEAVVEAIDRAGLTWIAPDPESLADVYRDIALIADRLGVPDRGRALVASMQRDIGAGSARWGPSVLVEWWPKPVIVPGRRSWVTDLITVAGGRNPFGDRDVRSMPVTDAEVLAHGVDAVVICWCGVPFERYRPDVVARRAAWSPVGALQNGQIHCIPEAHLGRPGPRLVEGVRDLRRVISGL